MGTNLHKKRQVTRVYKGISKLRAKTRSNNLRKHPYPPGCYGEIELIVDNLDCPLIRIPGVVAANPLAKRDLFLLPGVAANKTLAFRRMLCILSADRNPKSPSVRRTESKHAESKERSDWDPVSAEPEARRNFLFQSPVTH